MSVSPDALRDAMLTDSITQIELSRRTGISQSTISRYADGTVVPSAEYASRLVAALPSLRKIYENRRADRRESLCAEAAEIATQIFVPLFPAGFHAGRWEVALSETGFPEAYNLAVLYNLHGTQYKDSISINFGTDFSKDEIMKRARKTVATLRDDAGVIP